MAKPTAPLLSFSAAGQIAKTQVYARWRGRPYVRRYVVPFNPQTTAQTQVRSVFSFLQAVYKLNQAIATAPWDAYASGKPLIGRNAFVKFNLANLQTPTTLALMEFSPGALGGLPPASITVTPAAGQLTIAVTAPSVLPSGWTITAAQAAALKDQDPHAPTVFTVTAGEDLSSPYSIVLTGLPTGLTRVGAWLKWLRPDGKVAYSPAVKGSGTVT
jgi:hypothetical protein